VKVPLFCNVPLLSIIPLLVKVPLFQMEVSSPLITNVYPLGIIRLESIELVPESTVQVNELSVPFKVAQKLVVGATWSLLSNVML
jgi:hypothetical protein